MAKIDVIKQHDLKDCGACSLACIINYYNGYIPLEKIRSDTCTNTFGTTAYHIIKAAEHYGFEEMGVKAKNLEDENIYLPAIAHIILKNGLNHFIVIYKITSNYVWAMDPAKGKVKIKKNEFLEIWDNVIILLNPISNIIRYEKRVTISSIFFKLIRKNKKLFMQICLINIFLMILTILSNFYFKVSISTLDKGQDLTFIKFIILLFAIINLFKIMTTFIKNYYFNFFNKNLDIELYTDFLSHIFNLPLKFMQNRTTGEIVFDIMLNYQTTGFRETAALRELTGKTAIPAFQRWLEKMGFAENGKLTSKAGDGSSLLF